MRMDEVLARYDRVRRKLAAIRTWRKHYREYPVLHPHGRPELKPKYADKERCILAPGRYRNVVCVLIRREHQLKECLILGEAVWTTHRAEDYAWEGIEESDSKELKDAQWDAALLLDRGWTPRDLLIRTYKAGTTIAVNARIVVTTPDGELRSKGIYSTRTLKKLDYEEGDSIEVTPIGPPPAGILAGESDAAASEVVGLGIAARRNIMVVGMHGWVTRAERCLLSTLASMSLLEDKRVGVLSDLDVGGIRINKAIRLGSDRDGKYAVPRATRVGLTGVQLDRDCDGCLARVLFKKQLEELKGIVYRSTQPQ